jgi:hypothetical protein
VPGTGKKFAEDTVYGASSQYPRGETAESFQPKGPDLEPETGDDTALKSGNPQMSRKIESLPGAGQLQVASK